MNNSVSVNLSGNITKDSYVDDDGKAVKGLSMKALISHVKPSKKQFSNIVEQEEVEQKKNSKVRSFTVKPIKSIVTALKKIPKPRIKSKQKYISDLIE